MSRSRSRSSCVMHSVHCFVMEKYCLACGKRWRVRLATRPLKELKWKLHLAAVPLAILCIMVFGLLTFMALDYHSATGELSSRVYAILKFVVGKVKVELLVEVT